MRTASSIPNFPYELDTTAFIYVYNEHTGGRGFEHASHREKKRELVEKAIEASEHGGYAGGGEAEPSLLAVWPGATRSDVFLVDDLGRCAEAFG